jgi:hypothetical protein
MVQFTVTKALCTLSLSHPIMPTYSLSLSLFVSNIYQDTITEQTFNIVVHIKKIGACSYLQVDHKQVYHNLPKHTTYAENLEDFLHGLLKWNQKQ